MGSSPVASAQQWLAQHESALIQSLQALLRIPSIEGEAAPNAPFGTENRKALDLVLAQAQSWGMKTKDVDGFCGWAEFGTGDKLIAVLCHLDVVPVGPGWKFDPFGATIDAGYLYSRGAVDDKGPTMAAFYAAQAIHATFPEIQARIRVVFGCNEESGFKCIERYAETEELPQYGFAPDAGWPLYNGEKGIANLRVTLHETPGFMKVRHFEGGQRTNIVIDHAVGTVEIDPSVRTEVEQKLEKAWDKNLSFKWEGNLLHVEAVGKAAHGSWPHGGDNAATRILRFWMEIAPTSSKRTFEDLFEMAHISGEGLGIHGRDDISELTCNLGIVRTQNGKVQMTFNIRYPVTWTADILKSRSEEMMATVGKHVSIELVDDSKPLYFPIDHPLTKTVLEVYEAETGEKRKPGVMGGGTYARAIPNCVAIGTGWEGDGDAHQTDERIKVDHLLKMARIYSHILVRLADPSV